MVKSASDWMRVSSHEDAIGYRAPRIRVDVSPGSDVIIELECRQARALARSLNKHANFLDPPKRKRR